ncbi:glycosyltransferase family 2 protein [Kitasatospora sp. NPDC056138]|uniref:glycosyltransferase family 2 protein n=1 Tax=Kitasatospora sp. NPDC056138 TaxID=3345724 RepID=UPI0035DC46FD
MAEPEITVVIPAHNRTRALQHCLASLQRQTLDPGAFEIIVVDDGSTEPVGETVAQFADGDRIRLLRHERARGAGAARNTGAAAARGGLLVLLDADCLCHPDLLRAHLDAQADGPVAVCGYGAGRELTPAQWRLKHGADWDFADPDAVFARLARTPSLHDPLTELLARPRPADWAFFWTLNTSVPKSFFDLVGGFDTRFEVKGIEDIELGCRLARAGLPTVFAPAAITLHQPHERDRNREVVRDRRNEHILVRAYPSLDVEAVCSYDIAHSRDLIPALERFSDHLDAATADCGRLAALDGLTRRITDADGPVLLVGAPQGWPAGLPAPDTVCYPADLPPGGPGHQLRLLGTRLPGAGKHYALGVITDYWRHFPDGTFSRVLAELDRVCREVFVLSGVSTAPVAAPDPELSEALAAYDRPYWEFTTPLRRELHQFDLTEDEAGTPGPAAFRCTPVPWPMTELTDVGMPAGEEGVPR